MADPHLHGGQPPSQHNSQPTYSNVVNSHKYPNKDQAIVLPAIEGIKIHEYIIAVGTIVLPKNVHHASRIGNNRICLYLSSRNIVDNLINTHNSINVSGTNLEVRRLITPAQRLVISNICPFIPNSMIEDKISNMGITAISKITTLRVGMPEAEYSHVLSFRRQLYIEPLEEASIPDSFTISYDNTSYRIYMYIDGKHCTKCKSIGHQDASHTPCIVPQTKKVGMDLELEPNKSDMPQPNNPPNREDIETLEEPPTGHASAESNIVPIPTHNLKTTDFPPTSLATENTQTTISAGSLPSSSQQAKRQISTSPEIKTSTPTFATPKEPTPKPIKPRKKPKTSTEDVCQLMTTVKDKIENHKPPFTLNYNEICDFIENATNSKDPQTISQNYTNDTTEIREILNLIYSNVQNKSLKNKITRLKKKLSLISLSATDETDSEALSQC